MPTNATFTGEQTRGFGLLHDGYVDIVVHFLDGLDNCPAIVNPDQTDTDGDGRGDACQNLPPGC